VPHARNKRRSRQGATVRRVCGGAARAGQRQGRGHGQARRRRRAAAAPPQRRPGGAAGGAGAAPPDAIPFKNHRPTCALQQAQASSVSRRVRARQQAHAHGTHHRVSLPHASQACMDVRTILSALLASHCGSVLLGRPWTLAEAEFCLAGESLRVGAAG